MPDLWPFPVRQPVSEVLEWNTDTLITEAAEQRIALRTVPRSILTFTHLLDTTGLAHAAELARAGLVDKWTVPLWHLARPATLPVDAADLTVFVDTSQGIFEAAGQAVIAADGGESYLVEISAVFTDRLELAAPAGMSLAHLIVAPVGIGILTRPIEIDRCRQGLGTVTATFTLQDGTDMSETGHPTHLGLDVLTDPAVLRQPIMVWNFVVQIVASLVLTAISYALSPKPKLEVPKAAGLDDFDLPTAEEGRPIPVVFGTMLLRGPNVVWAGDLKVDPIRKKGGKK